MLKKVAAIFLLFAFVAQTFHKAWIVVSFYSNREYITQTQCENKYRPMLHCNGQCALAKKLKQEEKKEQNNPETKLENKNEVFSSAITYHAFSNTVTILTTSKPLFNTGSPIDISGDFFHPPGA